MRPYLEAYFSALIVFNYRLTNKNKKLPFFSWNMGQIVRHYEDLTQSGLVVKKINDVNAHFSSLFVVRIGIEHTCINATRQRNPVTQYAKGLASCTSDQKVNFKHNKAE
jgi:hypothetical protein